jgi:nucleoside-diphosphate-sugar epimerase
MIFNVGADTPYSGNALARAAADAFGVEPNVQHLPARFSNIEVAKNLPPSWK